MDSGGKSKDEWSQVSFSHRTLIVLVCFLIIVLDGLDTTSIGFVAPLLTKEWGLDRAAFTPAFVATNVGALIGYLICGPLAQRFGSRSVGALSVVLFGGGTALTALAYNVPSLTALRFFSAIGLGAVLPIAITAATQVFPMQKRPAVAMFIATGLSVGVVFGGLTAGPIMQALGWHAIFLLGGLAPFLLLPLFIYVLPTDAIGTKAKADAFKSTVAPLFKDGLAPATILLWVFTTVIGLVTYSLQFWIPTLLLDFGFSVQQAPLGAAALGFGGLIGNIVTMTVVNRIGTQIALLLAAIFAVVCTIVLSGFAVPQAYVLPLIAGISGGIIVGYAGSTALGVMLYPMSSRATGIGCASAMARVGAIVGPAVGGIQLALGWPARDIILTLVPAIVIAIAALAGMAWIEKARARAAKPA